MYLMTTEAYSREPAIYIYHGQKYVKYEVAKKLYDSLFEANLLLKKKDLEIGNLLEQRITIQSKIIDLEKDLLDEKKLTRNWMINYEDLKKAKGYTPRLFGAYVRLGSNYTLRDRSFNISGMAGAELNFSRYISLDLETGYLNQFYAGAYIKFKIN